MDQRVKDIVTFAYENAPATKQRMIDAGFDPLSVNEAADLAMLPPITKEAIAELQMGSPPFGGMLAVPISELKWVFFSPGPLYEGVMDDQAAVEANKRMLTELGMTREDVVLNSLSYHLVPFGVQIDAAVRELDGTVIPAGTGNSDLQAKMIVDLGVTVYVGTPSFLLALIQKIEESGADFQKATKLRRAAVSAEPLPPSLREALESRGIQLFNLYGTADLGVLGYECEEVDGWHIPENIIVQVCDPQTGEILPAGEVGEVVVTTFNRAFPQIRIGTGDLSIYNDQPCQCGRPSHRLMGWLGRSGGALKVRGMFLYPTQLQFVMGNFTDVEGYQAIIDRDADSQRDSMTLKVIAAGGTDHEALAEQLNEAIPNVCRVRPDFIEFVSAGDIDEEAPSLIDLRTWD